MMLILLIHGQSIPCHLLCPHGSGDKESTCNAGDLGLMPRMERPSGEGIGYPLQSFLGFPCGSAGKESACNVRDLGSISGLGIFFGDGKGYPLQYSGLKNPWTV